MATRKKKPPARKKAAARPAGSRRSKPKPAAAAPVAPALTPHQQVLQLAFLGELVETSRPGGPSTHPDRPPVPAAPSLAMRMIGGMVGRQVGLDAFRPPPVQEGGAEIDMCADCDVDCCTGHFIPINVFDAWRIRNTLNLPFSQFVGFVPWEKGLPVHKVRLDAGMFAMILKRRQDRGCGFLIRMGNERRCGIHGVRPDACRIFPYEPDLEEQTKQPGHSLLQIHPSHCPWRWPATPEHKARLLEDIKDNRAHRDFDRTVLSAWFWVVGAQRNPETFFRFLEDEVPRLLHRPQEPSVWLTTAPG